MADERLREAEQALADAGFVHERAGEREQRHGEQRKRLQSGEDPLRHDRERDPLRPDHEGRGRDHRDRDRRADQEEPDEGDEEERQAMSSSWLPTRSAGHSVSREAAVDRVPHDVKAGERGAGRHRADAPGGRDAHHRRLGAGEHDALLDAEPDEAEKCRERRRDRDRAEQRAPARAAARGEARRCGCACGCGSRSRAPRTASR